MKRLFNIVVLATIVALIFAAVEATASTAYAAEDTGLLLEQSSSPLMTANAWNALGSGLSATVFAIAVNGTDIYAGGQFIDAGGDSNADCIAKWDGVSWSALGTGLNGTVRTIVSNGSDIYVGGDFVDAGGDSNADYVAKWDGVSWSALGTGLNSTVHVIAVSGSNVYVAGNFTDASGNANADYIAKLDGNTWEPVGSTPLNGAVYSAFASGGELYAGGDFLDAGGNANADKIAKWNGASWSALGSGLNNNVYAVVLHGGDVYAGGQFTDASGNANADYIARWDGTSWSDVGGGLDSNLRTIATNGTEMYVGGFFTDAGGDANADRIAKWDGTSWSALGTMPLNGAVYRIVINGLDLYAGGQFTDAGGNANADRIARFEIDVSAPTVTSFTALTSSPSLDIPITAFTASDNAAVAGYLITETATLPSAGAAGWTASVPTAYTVGSDGSYTLYPWAKDAAGNVSAVYGSPASVSVDTTPPTLYTNTWNALGNGLSNTAYSIAMDGADVYTVGSFLDAGSYVNGDRVAKWNGTSWSPLGSGLNATVNSVVVSGSSIYAGGNFSNAGGDANFIAQWNGSTWSALGSGLNSAVNAMAVNGTDLYVGGNFSNAGGDANADYVAKWDGAAWSALGTTPLTNVVYATAVSGSDVYVGGEFLNAGGDANADRIAKWNGSSWSALGNGLNSTIYAMAPNGTDLYVGGAFTNVGGDANASYIAKWNGSSWSALGTGLNGIVFAIAVNGTDIYVGGNFTDAGGDANADYIAKWDGAAWSALGTTPLNNTVRAVAASGPDVYASGNFTDAGGNLNADRIARFVMDGIAPTVTSFTVPSSSNSLDIPITAFTASDDTGVSGYLITESNTSPSAGAAGWTVSAPTTYIVGSEGSYTLYPWSKDAAGNVSAVYDSPASVSVDASAPTVTSFSAPSSATSLDIPITAFTASDNIAVTGYKITESSTPPAASDAVWSASAPTSYTVPGNGNYTLYPWAKDAAGNVSAVYGSPASVSVDTTAPTVTSFIVPSSSNSLAIPITTFTASDGMSVAGYLITESATPPLSGTAGWTGSAPTTYTVGSNGSYTLYPWAKDTAGHVSLVYGSPASVDVDIPLIVTNTNDSGAGSLRGILASAAPGDTITFDAALSGGTITLASTITLDKDLTIDGSSLTSPITISGNNAYRVFQVNSGVTATLDSLTITNGYVSNNVGGGIRNQGTLTVNNSTISNNSANWGGGGIFSNSGTLTVTNSTFSDNNGGIGGGGIYSSVPLTVMNSTFSGNSGALGGGIGVENFTTATVSNSTFSGNLASNKGGGIFGHATLTVTNSTLSGNSATVSGGGIYSTASGTLNYTNTIIANSSSGGDCVNDGTLGTNTNNLAEDGSCSASLSGDPLLGPLQDNGGFTQTMALGAGSPAIDAGDDANCPATDQRGVTRPQGSRCDIGAYELEQGGSLPTTSTFTDVPNTHPYWQDIEILYANGLTAGCVTTPLKFCPDQIMDRAQSAVFMLRGSLGVGYEPPTSLVHRFQDNWSPGPWAEKWAEGMFNAGMTAGCTTSGPLKFCPWEQMPREQAVIFGLRLKYGNNYTPPPATGTLFADMTDTGYYATKWAEQASIDGLIPACGTSGGKPKFCPKELVTRGLGAYIIVKAKDLSMP